MAGTARILVVMGRLNRGAAPASHSLPRHPAHDQPYDTYTSPTIAGEHPRPVYRIASHASRCPYSRGMCVLDGRGWAPLPSRLARWPPIPSSIRRERCPAARSRH